MSRYLEAKREIIESGSGLSRHSMNQERIRIQRDKAPSPNRKIINAQRRRSRRFLRAMGKVRCVLRGTFDQDPFDNPISKKDLRYLRDAVTAIDPSSGEESSPEEMLKLLHIIGHVARTLWENESTIGTVGYVLLRSSRQVVMIDSQVCQGMEDSIDCLRERGLNIEVTGKTKPFALKSPGLRRSLDLSHPQINTRP